jgi:Domain of unknown function (DUF4286)
MSLVYEVTAVVELELSDGWERYMRDRHIPDVLATGCFTRASLARASGGRYLIRYHLASPADLERYLGQAAPTLRAEFAAHYPGGVALTRETWELVQEWEAGRSPG